MKKAIAYGDIDSCVAILKMQFENKISTTNAILEQHGHDESWHPGNPPNAVFFPENTADVAACVEICAEYRVPVIPFGTGSSMEGNVNAVLGGVSIDTSRLEQIIQVNPGDMDCEVEAGVTREQLNHYLRDTGLFFPVDPGANASIGGMAATRASGTTTVKYGSMRENVIGLEVVTAEGKIIEVGGRARKSSSGYDLTRLFVGSEGTLGVITRVKLRLHPLPESVMAITACFPTCQNAVEATCEVMQMGIPVARAELMDELAIQAVNNYCGTDYPCLPSLFFEFHGGLTDTNKIAEQVRELFSEHNVVQIENASTPEACNKIWDARHQLAFAERTLRPGSQTFVTDVAVPVTAMPEAILAAKDDLEKTGLIAPLCGHVGDGNFHFAVLIDRSIPQEVESVEQFHHRLVSKAIALGGTVSGEHGIGMGKMKYMKTEHGDSLELMQSIKAALDPKGIMNPDKIFTTAPLKYLT
jgi:D-lactate dehydrogenase (cytochrome)